MSVEWYYTTNKQQMGAISWSELRELADSGGLKPTDLVWSEGMAEWINAGKQQGLFAIESPDDAEPVKKKSSAKASAVLRRRREDEDHEDEEEEERPRREKRTRRRQESSGGVHVGVKIGLALAGIFALFVMCGGCAIGIAWVSLRDGGGGGPARIQHNFTIVNLHERRWEERRFHFPKDRRLLITVTGNAPFGSDIDLHIHRGQGPGDHLIALDESIGPHSRLEFTVPASDTYRIRVANLGPGMANSCHVSITER